MGSAGVRQRHSLLVGLCAVATCGIIALDAFATRSALVAALGPHSSLAVNAMLIRHVVMGLLVLATLWLAISSLSLQGQVRQVGDTLQKLEGWESKDADEFSGAGVDNGELGRLGGAVDALMDRLAEAQARQVEQDHHHDLLVRELDHRVKNLLSTVQAIARQTFKANVPPAEASATFSHRLIALTNAHALLTQRWQGAALCATVDTAIRPFQDEGSPKLTAQGPDLQIRANAALSLSMSLHELCTNAVKYGALSTDAGYVAVRWAVEEHPQGGVLVLHWEEFGGPPVEPPSRQGFGSAMIQRVLVVELGAETDLDYKPNGLACRMVIPLKALLACDQVSSEPEVY